MIVLITGATGLIGQEIVRQFHEKGHIVHYLTTSKSKLQTQENYKGFYWNVAEGHIDHSCLEGVEVIIHLVGASISKRWTSSYKKEILDSRVDSANLIAKTIKVHNFSVRHVISASAIGIYPSSLTNYYSETELKISDSFLGEVVDKWEKAVEVFQTEKCIVSKIRIGLVLSDSGGALPEIMKPVKFGLGACFGSGEQWQSWIHITDLARIFMFVMTEELEGIFNGVAPNPVSNKELTKSVASVLQKPLILPGIPKAVMSIALGEMHIILYESQRVSSAKIESEGFQFRYPNLAPALQSLLN